VASLPGAIKIICPGNRRTDFPGIPSGRIAASPRPTGFFALRALQFPTSNGTCCCPGHCGGSVSIRRRTQFLRACLPS
jgi:hypothetical protein